MPSGTPQVEETTFGQDDDAVAVGEDESVALRLDVLATNAGHCHEPSHINFVIEMPNVPHDGVVLHFSHVRGHDDVLVTSGGDEDVGSGDNVFQGGNLVALHAGLQGANGVNLGDDDTGTAGLHGGGAPLADITVPGNERGLPSNHDIGGTHDAVGEGVTAAVDIVKFGLGHRVVDVDGREEEGAASGHFIQTLHPGGGLFAHPHQLLGHASPLGAVRGEAITDEAQHDLELQVVGGGGVGEGAVLGVGLFGLDSLVDEQGGVATVIYQKVGPIALGPGEGLLSAPPVLLQGLALPGKDGRGVTGDGSGSVVLGGEDVAGAPTDLSTEGDEGLDESGGLDGHVQGASDLGALEWLLGAEFLTAGHEAWHLCLSELNFQTTEIGLGHVLDLVLLWERGGAVRER